MLQRFLLNSIADLSFRFVGPLLLPIPIKPCPAHLGKLAHPFDTRFALLAYCALDRRVDPASELTFLLRGDSLIARKAAAKKSKSAVCWPIRRSRSAIFCCCSASCCCNSAFSSMITVRGGFAPI